MVYFGKVKNGRIELEQPVELPEGVRVRIEAIESVNGAPSDGPDAADDLASEAVNTGATDMSEEHDHYASGAPRRRKER